MKEMLLIAKSDLDTARKLYRGKKYSDSLYHYHQCVEKTVKYIGLSTGIIADEQLSKEIKHDPIKIFKILLEYASEQLDSILPPIDKHIFTNAKQIIDSESEDFIVNQVKTTIKSISNEKNAIDVNKYSSHFDAVCDHIAKIIPEMASSLKNLDGNQYLQLKFRDQVEDFLLFINYGVKILEILLMNALICCKYKPDDFRYFNSKIGNPLRYFKKKNPFIKNLPYLMKSMELPLKYAGQIKWSQNF